MILPLEKYVPIKWIGVRSLSKITVEIVDEKWNTVSQAKVLFVFPGGSFGEIATFGEKKNVVSILIPTMNYTIRVLKEGYLPHEETLELPSTPSTVGKIIQICRGIKLRVEIVDEKRVPIKDVNVTLPQKMSAISIK